jgi:hypothetical protein
MSFGFGWALPTLPPLTSRHWTKLKGLCLFRSRSPCPTPTTLGYLILDLSLDPKCQYCHPSVKCQMQFEFFEFVGYRHLILSKELIYSIYLLLITFPSRSNNNVIHYNLKFPR